MGLTAAGIGSGLDVESLISQMVTLQKSPLKALQSTASSLDTQISAYGKLKSLMSTLNDASRDLAKKETWQTTSATSSSSSVVVSVTDATALPGTSDVVVEALARGQSQASALLDASATFGGTLQLTVGKTNPVTTEIKIAPDTSDASMEDVVKAINAAGAGVTASIMTNADGKRRLVLRSQNTGEEAKFSVSASGNGNLNALATGAPLSVKQDAQNARIKLNGITVESASNEFKSVLPGLSISVSQVSETPASVTVKTDKEALKKSLQTFMDAYNALNDMLATSTKYDAESKTAGTLQGDSTAVSMTNSLRAAMAGTVQGIGSVNRLSELGIQIAKGGKISFGTSTADKAKLEKALDNPDSLNSLFVGSDITGQGNTQGLAVRMQALTKGMTDFEGTLDTKTNSLNAQKKSNTKAQERVNDQATAFEARMRAQYTALDTKMASLSTLSTYMSQQVSQWNRG
ncbi:flagellar filament capping protein FliD [Comamonas thiooxydans]|uniref:Flagellar hook-associated protein 2 n=1 Tax=Comamonas thiooxydans TaxID=363952 RepID=A0A0E3BTV6_9BURK|nr:flagellar filament capping protein FliD [Comamonas thiooxydans]KGH03538.1 flagellar hook protein [Comamonas thiooxydans]KGH17427.1 flagellar hook protein [Comamonas thiooxydans]KGH18849.1 flagellar hook protein [Comamonas thiooxydans]